MGKTMQLKLSYDRKRGGDPLLKADYILFLPSSPPADSLNVTIPFASRGMFYHTSKHIGLQVARGNASFEMGTEHHVNCCVLEKTVAPLPTLFYEFSRGVWPFESSRTCAVVVNGVRPHLHPAIQPFLTLSSLRAICVLCSYP